MDNIKLGERVRAARGELSLREFAKKCGISHTHLDSIEKGYDPRTGNPVRISMDALAKLSLGTGYSIYYLMGEDPEPAFRGSAYEGMTKTEAELYKFASEVDGLVSNAAEKSMANKERLIKAFGKLTPFQFGEFVDVVEGFSKEDLFELFKYARHIKFDKENPIDQQAEPKEGE